MERTGRANARSLSSGGASRRPSSKLWRHSGACAARARNPYSRSWLWIPGSFASLTPRNDGLASGFRVRVKSNLLKRINVILPVQSPLQKYSASPVGQIISTNSRHPTPPEGRIMIVTDAGRDAVDAAALGAQRGCRAGWRKACERSNGELTNDGCSVRRSRVVLTPRRWRQVRGGLVGPTGRGQSLNPLGDGGKKDRSPGRARRKPLKPLRAGMPGDSGVLVVTRVRSTTTRAHEAAGATGTRRSPRPLR